MLIIGERINATRKGLQEAFKKKDAALIQDEARKQAEAGADYLDVNAGLHPDQEKELMIWACESIQEVSDRPLSIDSANPQVIAAGLAAHKNGKPMVNSISLEKGGYEQTVPLVKQYNASVIALTKDEHGLPQSVDDRLRITEKIIKVCTDAGIELNDIYVDPLALTVGTDQNAGLMVMLAVHSIKQNWPGIRTTVGLSNISFGLPHRGLINRTFLAMLIAAGIDAVIIDPTNMKTFSVLAAARLLAGQDEMCMSYITAYREEKLEP